MPHIWGRVLVTSPEVKIKNQKNNKNPNTHHPPSAIYPKKNIFWRRPLPQSLLSKVSCFVYWEHFTIYVHIYIQLKRFFFGGLSRLKHDTFTLNIILDGNNCERMSYNYAYHNAELAVKLMPIIMLLISGVRIVWQTEMLKFNLRSQNCFFQPRPQDSTCPFEVFILKANYGEGSNLVFLSDPWKPYINNKYLCERKMQHSHISSILHQP